MAYLIVVSFVNGGQMLCHLLNERNKNLHSRLVVQSVLKVSEFLQGPWSFRSLLALRQCAQSAQLHFIVSKRLPPIDLSGIPRKTACRDTHVNAITRAKIHSVIVSLAFFRSLWRSWSLSSSSSRTASYMPWCVRIWNQTYLWQNQHPKDT